MDENNSQPQPLPSNSTVKIISPAPRQKVSNKNFFLLTLTAFLILSAVALALTTKIQPQDREPEVAGIFDFLGNESASQPTPSPSVCDPINQNGEKLIEVFPSNTAIDKCTSLQKAIDRVDGPYYRIKLKNGLHTVPEANQAFSVVIDNKHNLSIEGDTAVGVDASQISFSTRGGLQIKNSSNIRLTALAISGQTTNGMVRIEDSSSVQVTYLNVNDANANAVQIIDSSGLDIRYNSFTAYGRVAMSMSTSSGEIAYNRLSNNNIAIQANNSNLKIHQNTITHNQESGIVLYQPQGPFRVTSNSFLFNGSKAQPNTAALVINNYSASGDTVNIFKNLFTNNYQGLLVENSDPFTNLEFTANNFYNNQNDVSGFDPSGTRTMYVDPEFGANNCIEPTSPIVYGVLTEGEYVGAMNMCSLASASPMPVLEELVPVSSEPLEPVMPQPSVSPAPTVSSQPSSSPILYMTPSPSPQLSQPVPVKQSNVRILLERIQQLISRYLGQ